MKPGDRVGKYTLEERLGTGGMAEVWAARVEGPGDFIKPVALKFILPTYSNDPEYGRMFMNEARLAAELQHANLVSIIDLDRVPSDAAPELAGRYFIAMERVDGRDLATVVRRAIEIGKPLAVNVAVHIVCEVLVGLRYIHERERLTKRAGLVHRDISPHNVLVSFAGEIKVSDFGVAKLDSSQSTMDGRIRGKIPYFAPELLRGERATHHTDQFAAGIVLWELLSGRMLFSGAHDAEILEKVRACNVPPPARPGQEIPRDLAAVVLRMLSRDRETRFPATSVALEALTRFGSGAGGSIRVSEVMLDLFAPTATPPPQSSVAGATAIVPGLANRLARDGRDAPVQTAPNGRADSVYTPSGTRVIVKASAGAASIPRRLARIRLPDFSEEREREARQTAENRYALALSAGFEGSLLDWFRHHAERSGWDVFTARKLPDDWSEVVSWPRLANLGWERALLVAWNGPYPWGEDGYWVAEDPLADEIMAIRSDHLGREPFRQITRAQWHRWWLDREVDPDTELPGGRTPVSRKARVLIPTGTRPPASSAEWEALCRVEWDRDDQETLRAMKRLEVLSAPPEPGPSLWQRLIRLSRPDDTKGGR